MSVTNPTIVLPLLFLLQILRPIIAASRVGVIVDIGGKLHNLVPAMLGWRHDNPEGRDVLCVWSSPKADQMCCLC